MKKKSDFLLVVLLAITLAIASSCNSAREEKKITAPASSIAAVTPSAPQKTICANNGNTSEKHYYAWGSTGKERTCPDYPNGTDLQKSRLVVTVGKDGRTAESTEYEWVCHGYY